jgi:hypothetical protein
MHMLCTTAHLCVCTCVQALDLVAKVSTFPSQLEPDDAAEAAQKLSPQAQKLFHASLVRLVQSLVAEVESGREALIDTQSAMASLLRRMHSQHDNCMAAHASVETMERAVGELVTSNTQMRYKLMERPRSGGPSGRQYRAPGGPRSPAEREARELLPADWELREAPAGPGSTPGSTQLLLVAEPSSSGTRTRPPQQPQQQQPQQQPQQQQQQHQQQRADGLMVAGTSPASQSPPSPQQQQQQQQARVGPHTRHTAAPSQSSQQQKATAEDRRAVLAFGTDATTRQRHREWVTAAATADTMAGDAPAATPCGASAPPNTPPDSPHMILDEAGRPRPQQAATPSAADVGRAAEAAARATSGGGSGGSARPWSERAAQLDALRASGSEAAAAAAAATAAASALAAGQHRYWVAHGREPPSSLRRPASSSSMRRPASAIGVTSALSLQQPQPQQGIAIPAWRLNRKPFARSFSAGPIRPYSALAGPSPAVRQARAPGYASPLPFDHRRPASASASASASSAKAGPYHELRAGAVATGANAAAALGHGRSNTSSGARQDPSNSGHVPGPPPRAHLLNMYM